MHKNIPPNDDKADIPNNNIPKPDIMPAENNWFIILSGIPIYKDRSWNELEGAN